ncbi:MAG: response regulator [Anaerolineae bacterium]|nr:response regulator [Anaerolineae bacterium]
MRILLVDDNPADRELVRRRLRAEFPDATFTEIVRQSDLDQALERGEFDLVLTDYHLHWSDGLRVLAQVRERYPYVPVIMLTDTGSEEVAVSGLQTGLNDYVLKRHLPRLPQAIRRCLEEIHLRRERDEAMEQLCASEARYRLLAENASDIIFTLDMNLRFTYISPAVTRIRGFTVEEAIAQTPAEALTPASLEVAMRVLQEELERELRGNGEPFRTRVLELEETCKDGSTVWTETTFTPLRDERGQMIGILGITRDISERKRAERELQRQMARVNLLNRIVRAIAERQDLESIFRTVLWQLEEEMPADMAGILLLDSGEEALNITALGPRAKEQFAALGLTEGMSLSPTKETMSLLLGGQTVFIPDLEKQTASPIAQSFARMGVHSAIGVPLMVEEKVFGVLFVARREPYAFSSAAATFLRALAEHVSLAAHHARLYQGLQVAYQELRQTQQAVMEQERLRALGQMASGIAHDINNAISPAVLYTRLLLRDPELPSNIRPYVEAIAASCEDVTQTVARMREFYRRPAPEETLAPVNLNRVVEEIASLTRPRWRDIPHERGITIHLQMELDPQLPEALAREPQIREALTNLIFNAVDAMPEGGVITLRTRYLPAPGEHQGGHVVLEVADTGIGMDEETRRRAIEPFFTTKPGGSGMGLAMVYGIVQQHEGHLEIDSAYGQGTTVRIILPLRVRPITVTAEGEEEVTLSPLRILFIDDEPLIRHSLREALTQEGHTVEVADSGEAGLMTFYAACDRGEPFDVVITDLGMPYVDGREVARRVKSRSPETPVVMLSGWGILLDEERIPPQVDGVLSKPPRMEELRRMLVRLCAQ